jgi:hypothetical protein
MDVRHGRVPWAMEESTCPVRVQTKTEEERQYHDTDLRCHMEMWPECQGYLKCRHPVLKLGLHHELCGSLKTTLFPYTAFYSSQNTFKKYILLDFKTHLTQCVSISIV